MVGNGFNDTKIKLNKHNFFYLGYTVCDKLDVEGPCTVKQLIETIKNKYQVKLSMIFFEKFVIYNLYSKDQEEMEKR